MIGVKVILFSPDTETKATACEAVIERYREGWSGEPEKSFWFCGVRARPVEESWFSADLSCIERFNRPLHPTALCVG
jgi:hypothetical protein